jgi:predicted enzyme related to lactoylglutathione lyase
MSVEEDPSMTARVSKVVVPVDDQAVAIEFWTVKMGFELVRDVPYGSERWVEVKPPAQDLTLVLSQREAWEPRRDIPDQLPESPVMFDCVDVVQTYRELTGRGVKFPQPPIEQPFGWWALFEDPQGVRYALQGDDAD